MSAATPPWNPENTVAFIVPVLATGKIRIIAFAAPQRASDRFANLPTWKEEVDDNECDNIYLSRSETGTFLDAQRTQHRAPLTDVGLIKLLYSAAMCRYKIINKIIYLYSRTIVVCEPGPLSAS